MNPSHGIATSPQGVRSGHSFLRRLILYAELSKPRIAILELVVVVASAFLAAPYREFSSPLVIAMLIGTALIAASASALNQLLERDSDRQMHRTAARPLASGQLSHREVAVVATVALAVGFACLWLFARPIAAVVALASWFIYVVVYTPLKRISPCNTAVGAVAGALPVWIGWTAVGGELGFQAVAVFAVVYLWQFPHFMAIGWIYRNEYRSAGIRILPVADRSGFLAGGQAIAGSLALIPIGLLPALAPFSANVAVYAFWVLALGFAQAACAVAFAFRRDDTTARWLLRSSLVYLPSVFGLLMLTV